MYLIEDTMPSLINRSLIFAAGHSSIDAALIISEYTYWGGEQLQETPPPHCCHAGCS